MGPADIPTLLATVQADFAALQAAVSNKQTTAANLSAAQTADAGSDAAIQTAGAHLDTDRTTLVNLINATYASNPLPSNPPPAPAPTPAAGPNNTPVPPPPDTGTATVPAAGQVVTGAHNPFARKH